MAASDPPVGIPRHSGHESDANPTMPAIGDASKDGFARFCGQ